MPAASALLVVRGPPDDDILATLDSGPARLPLDRAEESVALDRANMRNAFAVVLGPSPGVADAAAAFRRANVAVLVYEPLVPAVYEPLPIGAQRVHSTEALGKALE